MQVNVDIGSATLARWFAADTEHVANINLISTRNPSGFRGSPPLYECTSSLASRNIEQWLCLQVNVDIIGVVTQAGPLGSVKRKVDASELQRRDVTITDQR